MEATAKVSAVLQNPTGLWEDEIPFDCPNPSLSKVAMLQIAGSFAKQGGLIRISGEQLEFIPIHRVTRLTVEVSSIQIAGSLEDIAAAARQQAATKKLVTG